jgi:hypothetical protein
VAFTVSVVASTSTSVTVHPVALPDGSNISGRRVIVAFHANGDPAITWPAGWTTSPTGWSDAVTAVTDGKLSIRYRDIDGSEGFTGAGDSINVTLDVAGSASAHAYLIAGLAIATAPEAAAVSTGNTTAPDPPSLNPAGWATEESLWIAVAGTHNPTNFTAAPADYTDLLNTNDAGTGSIALGSARRVLSTGTEDPGVFTTANQRHYVATTIAVRPGASGGAAVTGVADGTFVFTGTASGQTTNVTGTGLGAFTFTGTAAGFVEGSPPTGLPTVTASGTPYAGNDGTSTTHGINCPAHSADDRLVLMMCWDGNVLVNSVTAVGGDEWETVANAPCDDTGAVTRARLHIYEIVARSSSGGSQTVTVTLSGSELGSARIVAVSDSHPTQPTEAATNTSLGSSTSPNPPALNPAGWAIENTLWLAVAAHDNTATTTGFPANYDENQIDIDVGSAGGTGLAYATRDLNAASDDPGSFTISPGRVWAAVTLAVRPATGGSGEEVVTGAASLDVISAGTLSGVAGTGKTGVAAGTFVFAGTAQGVGGTNIQGAGLAALTFTGTAQGQGGSVPTVTGVAIGAFEFVATASDGLTVFLFTPPTTGGNPVGVKGQPGYALWRYYDAWATGQTVWKDQNGDWHEALNPYQGGDTHRVFDNGELVSEKIDTSVLSLANAERVYYGGHDYVISEEEADELIEAGYGPNIVEVSAS